MTDIISGAAKKVWVASDPSHPFPVQFGDSPSIDAFGRQRISSSNTRFDAQFTYDLQPLLFEQLTSGVGATITHNTDNRVARIQLSNTPANGHSYLQSYEWSHYLPGNSHLIIPTFNFKAHTPNVTKFVGYGDRTNNGVHFISDGTQFAWRILSNTDLGDETVTQSNWNLDTLDGSGNQFNPSGKSLNVNKTQIAVIDLQALYVGRVRVGFDFGDGITYCHEFKHANVSNFPYIQSATLPVIAGMQCSAEATAEMLFVCSTVRSEGADLTNEGFEHSAEGTGTAGNGTRAHILSVRPRTTFNGIENRGNIILESLDILVTGNNPVLWELCFGQAISGSTAFTNVNATYSSMAFNTAGTISGNPAIAARKGYVAATASQEGAFPSTLSNRYPITLDAAGAARALGTVATGIGGTSAMRATLNWREIR